MIQFFKLLISLGFACVLIGTAQADQRDGRLEPLFSALKFSHDVESARLIEGQIWEIWLQTEEGQASTLLEQGMSAMSNRDFLGAVEQFTRLIEIKPDFAEGWNKRATVYYLAGKLDESVEDIQSTLALEPRHFGALSGLGLIMMRLERPELALKSFEAAAEIHPHMPSTKAHIKLLKETVEGEAL